MKKSFSISTLLFFTVIIALIVSQVAMWRRLSDANTELELNRRRFGYIRVDDESKTYVSPIAEPNDPVSTAYRIRVPEGSRYLLHLTDMTFDGTGLPENPKPSKSISLNGWRDGADVILSYSLYWENDVPRFVVRTEMKQYFNYVPSDWERGKLGESWRLQTDSQKSYSTEETINFAWWHDSSTKRGILLWLEPHTVWIQKRMSKKKAPEPTN